MLILLNLNFIITYIYLALIYKRYNSPFDDYYYLLSQLSHPSNKIRNFHTRLDCNTKKFQAYLAVNN